LVEGRGLVESPRWHDGRLWFADWIAGEIVAVDSAGEAEVMLRHESLPLSFDFSPDGTPLIVSGPLKALVRASRDGSLATYADLSGLSPHGYNEIVVDGRGNAYVNNPGYDPMSGDSPDGEQAPGFVALVTPDGSATIVANDLAFPNGMVVTPDNATLVIAQSHRGRLTAFESARPATCQVAGSGPTSTVALPTRSAVMPTGRSGTPRYRTGAVCGSEKAAKSYRPSIWTRVRTPACSAVRSSPRCSSQPPTGQA
jgi:sugar lactone lactonase YvrE